MTQHRLQLLAHRGYPACFPENSLMGIKAALELGASAVEFDIQLSADRIPVVFHDEQLERVTGHQGRVMETSFAKLTSLSNGEAGRFGERFQSSTICCLKEMVKLLQSYPHCTAFVEVKRHSLNHFGIPETIEAILSDLQPILAQCVIISFIEDAVRYTRQSSSVPIGWILRHYDDSSKIVAADLKPDYLVSNINKIPTTGLWPGSWQWVVYETSDLKTALEWQQRGACYVETDAIGSLLNELQQNQ